MLFPLGRISATPAVLAALESHGQAPAVYLDKHLRLERGALSMQDVAANKRALIEDTRIVSAYRMPDGAKLWIITESDRRSTTILLPEEY